MASPRRDARPARAPRLLLDCNVERDERTVLPGCREQSTPDRCEEENVAMNAWVILFLAGLLEILWASGLRFTDGFTRPLPSIAVLVLAWLSFYLLALAMREIPMGTAYAVWTGIGATGVALLGMAFLKEPASVSRLLFLTMIVAGIIGLKWSSSSN